MARTRAQIKTFVNYYTGRGVEKASLIELLCDEALKIAGVVHPFKDAKSADQDFEITAGATSVSIATLTNIEHLVTARIVETSGSLNKVLDMKNETWWASNIVNESDNMQGWPEYGLRRGTTVVFNRPAQSGLSLRVVVTRTKAFTNDSTECPIAIADVFVTQYVTAMVFLSIEEQEKYLRWLWLAMGSRYLVDGKIGGTLAAIIELDKRDRAESFTAQPGPIVDSGRVAVENLIAGHEDYGNVRLWSRP